MKRWLKADVVEFDALIERQCSLDQMDRIGARLDMNRFIELHGRKKCDLMWVHLQAGGAKEDGPDVEDSHEQ